MYIYQQQGWPHFSWNQELVNQLLLQLRHQQGRLTGGMESFGFPIQQKAVLETLTQEVVKSSEIEGDILDQEQVRSSVARHLGIDQAATTPTDRHTEGVVEMILDATQKFDQPLSKERLFHWHRLLFPTNWSGFTKIEAGNWRKGPVQVVSGPSGREKIHFEGPNPEQVDREMNPLLEWINQETELDLVLKAAIAHFWFVTIHPLEDGNGRIGRAIAELLLARSENNPQRFYSLSAQIQAERKQYYAILEKSQKGPLDLTPWLEWFFSCLHRAIEKAIHTLENVKQKTFVWEILTQVPLNERQRLILNRLLDGFEGNLTSSKWAKIAKCSQDTAYRDILELTQRGILIKNPEGGRTTSYSLADLKNLK